MMKTMDSQNSTDNELGAHYGGNDDNGNSEISFKVGLMAKNGYGLVDESVPFADMEQTWDMVWNHLTAISTSSSSETGLYTTDDTVPLELDPLQLNNSLLLSDDETPSESSDRGIQIRGTSAVGGCATPPIGEKSSSRRRFRRKKVDPAGTTGTTKLDGATPTKKKRLRRFRRRPKEHIAQFRSDVVGIMFLEICHANDLPPERNGKAAHTHNNDVLIRSFSLIYHSDTNQL
jgi:phosphatidylserine decarboxylase